MSKATEIEVDGKTYKLVLDFNALIKVEEELGKNMMDMESWSNLSAKDSRYIMYAAMLKHQPGATIEEAGKLDISSIMNMASALMPEDTPDPLADRSQTIGPSPDTTSDSQSESSES